FFFFSSRRRHTRWPRDWSSDVCSSDLNALHGCGVRQLGHARDDVADGINLRFGGLHISPYVYEAALEFRARFFQADVLRQGCSSHRDQHIVGREILRLAGFIAKDHSGPGHVSLYGFHFRFGENADSPLAECPLQLRGNFLVFQGHNARKHFEDGYFRAEGAKNGGEFNADRTGADYHQRLGNFWQLENVAIANDDFGVEVDSGQRARFRARGEKDVGGFDVRDLSGILDMQMMRPRPAPPALDDLDLIFAEK